MKIGVVDYRAGNLRSVETVLKHLGADFFISNRPEEILAADKLIFPGVGEAKATMDVLGETGLGDAIGEFFSSGRPMLGICIGCQIALDKSEERGAVCLGLVPGVVRRFPVNHADPAWKGLKVPQMGWNTVHFEKNHPVFAGIPNDSSFYFVHSYYPDPEEDNCRIATAEYGITFTCGIEKDNLIAFQFHPEKSGKNGLRLIENFIKMTD
jgi:imidazole glycerol-phosphate synthase subunit HisH